MILRGFIAGLGLLVATPLLAEVAQVDSGEHGDFTRIVVEASDSSNWMLGRTDDGYALQMPDVVTGYDLRAAFEKIPKDRIVSLWQDPNNGQLRLALACACHVIAFEFRPGIVVMDIRNGPAPKESAFENVLPGGESVEKAASSDDIGSLETASADPVPPAYDWVALERSAAATDQQPVLPMDLPTGEVSLDPLRDALLGQISKGAASGVIEIAEGEQKPKEAIGGTTEGPWSRISAGELPGLAIGDARPKDKSLTSDGKACLGDKELDVSAWGSGDKPGAEIGLARMGMLAEFDAPSEEAILRSVKYHLFLGFGAEARQFLSFLGTTAPESANILTAMSYIVDDQAPAANPFQGMQGCDSNAALWANLAEHQLSGLLPGTNVEALARAFSQFPPHLRKLFGGVLIDRLLAEGDGETARKLRDSILRLPTDGDPDVALMDAKFQLSEGHDERAAELAEDVMSESGPLTAEAAVTLVEAAFQGDRQVDPDLPGTLAVFLRDARQTSFEAPVLRATILAYAMAKDFEPAVDLDAPDMETSSDLWSMLESEAVDEVFLTSAAKMSAQQPVVRVEVGDAVAQRLLELGFPDLALPWITPFGADSSVERRLLAARALLATGDAVAAGSLLEEMDGPDAGMLRAEADIQLGQLQSAAEELAKAGDSEASQRAVTWTQDWDLIEETGPENWKAAAELRTTPSADPSASGALARSAALIDESEKARMTLEALLAEAAVPAPSQ